MGFFDRPEEPHVDALSEKVEKKEHLQIEMPGGRGFVPLGKSQIRRKYEDEVGPRLIIIIDEAAELLMPTKVKTEAGKEEDALKQEIVSLIQSITQLGRSAGIHIVVCTQRNDASIIPGVIQSNSLALDTKLRVRRKVLND